MCFGLVERSRAPLLPAARLQQRLPDQESFRGVESQQFNGHAANLGQGCDARPFEAEMIGPPMNPRVEQRHDLAGCRVHGGDVGSLAPVAVEAGQSQVGQFSAAAAVKAMQSQIPRRAAVAEFLEAQPRLGAKV